MNSARNEIVSWRHVSDSRFLSTGSNGKRLVAGTLCAGSEHTVGYDFIRIVGTRIVSTFYDLFCVEWNEINFLLPCCPFSLTSMII